MRIAVLAKQVPSVEQMRLDHDGRLQRDGVELEMDAYSRRAVSQGVKVARETEGSCTVFSLGPPSAESVLREAIAWGAARGFLLTDRELAGSDTLVTARALACAVSLFGPFDCVLLGRSSVDAETGQLGPELAELLDWPFVVGAREMTLGERRIWVRSELDDGWEVSETALPAVVSVAERLCEPAKVDEAGCLRVPASKIRVVRARALGMGPWGAAGSPTTVGRTRTIAVERRRMLCQGDATEQARECVGWLRSWGVLDALSEEAVTTERAAAAVTTERAAAAQPPRRGEHAAAVDAPFLAVLLEPERQATWHALAGEAARLALRSTHPLRLAGICSGPLGPAGEEALVALPLEHVVVVEDAGGRNEVLASPGVCPKPPELAASFASWAASHDVWAVLAPGTSWGREVAGRIAARLHAGLVGDAIELGVEGGRLVAWKPAFGGQLVAAITCSSALQLVTLQVGAGAPPGEAASGPAPSRPAAKPPAPSRPAAEGPAAGGSMVVERLTSSPRYDSRILEISRDDDLRFLSSRAMVGVGLGVSGDDYSHLSGLCDVLDAALVATRKVTDRGWLPRARQVGLTGHVISPVLYVAVGISGRFNHMVGTRAARCVVAINSDADAPVFSLADVGLVGEWQDLVPALTAELRRYLGVARQR